jgi:hypothetical protein
MATTIIIFLLVLIVILLTAPQNERPRILGFWTVTATVGLLVYGYGTFVVSGFAALAIAVTPAIASIGRLLGLVLPYSFLGIMLVVDLFVAYALISGWERKDSAREKWAAIIVGVSTVPAVFGFAAFCLGDERSSGFIPLAVVLFCVGVTCLPLRVKQVEIQSKVKVLDGSSNNGE